MAQYPHLVQVAWDTVHKLVEDWRKNPHFWNRERDMQAELRGRLAALYSLLGVEEVIETKNNSADSDKTITYRYSRVACEPSVPYTYSDGKNYRAMPDIVVWDDLKDPNKDSESWPILWACEIKYMREDKKEWDVEKLGYLVQQDRIRFGCSLTFRWDDSLDAPTISWDQASHGRRLWKCIARSPYK